MNTTTDTKVTSDRDANRDPISGAPGAHPVGVGVGAAAAGAAGAAIGAVGGPVGVAVGAVVGAVAGGLTGKAVAESIDPTVEDAYWEERYTSRPYFNTGDTYDDYRPAYRTGYEGYTKYQGRKYDEVERELESDYERSKGGGRLTWERAKAATRDAWHKVERKLPGDADGDGL